MQSCRLVLRRSCRACNAYNVPAALWSAFSTTASHAATPGSFASYESILDQLSKPKPVKQKAVAASNKQQRIAKAAPATPSQLRDLQARQDAIERQLHRPQPLNSEPSSSPRTKISEKRPGPSVKPDGTTVHVPKSLRPASSRHKVNEHKDGSAIRPPATVPIDSEARSRHIRRFKDEQAEAERAAEQTKGGWKYVMHWVAKTAVAVTKDKKFDWKDDQLVRQVRKLLDYEAVSLSPAASQLSNAMPLPWVVNVDDVSKVQPMEILEQEIKLFAAWARPSQAEQASRQAVIDQTLQFIKLKLDRDYANLQTEIFGSERTGLATATSDIDIRIYDDSKGDGEEAHYVDIGRSMRKLHGYMHSSGDYICTVFRWARFPIISAQHRATGIDIQIVSSPSTVRQQAVTEQYLAELPYLRDLYFVTRTMLGMRNLIDVFNGGIGSYGLFIMLAGALKRRRSDLPTSAGKQLLQFLEMYGQQLDMQRHGLSVNTSRATKTFLKHHPKHFPENMLNQQQNIQAAHRRGDKIRAGQWAICTTRHLQQYLLCLQDPADPTNDLGRKTNGIKFIQKTCDALAAGLRSDLVAMQKDSEFDSSLLEPIVGRCHEVLAMQRVRIGEFGRQVQNRSVVQNPEPRAEKADGIPDPKPSVEKSAANVDKDT